jgi:hypothetical protein
MKASIEEIKRPSRPRSLMTHPRRRQSLLPAATTHPRDALTQLGERKDAEENTILIGAHQPRHDAGFGIRTYPLRHDMVSSRKLTARSSFATVSSSNCRAGPSNWPKLTASMARGLRRTAA